MSCDGEEGPAESKPLSVPKWTRLTLKLKYNLKHPQPKTTRRFENSGEPGLGQMALPSPRLVGLFRAWLKWKFKDNMDYMRKGKAAWTSQQSLRFPPRPNLLRWWGPPRPGFHGRVSLHPLAPQGTLLQTDFEPRGMVGLRKFISKHFIGRALAFTNLNITFWMKHFRNSLLLVGKHCHF